MAFQKDDENARNALKQLAAQIIDLPQVEYTRDTTLGLRYGFGEFKPEIDRIYRLCKLITVADLDLIPFDSIEQIRQSLQNVHGALSRMKDFNPERPDAVRERPQIAIDLKSAVRQAFSEFGVVLAFSVNTDDIAGRLQQEIETNRGRWEEQIGTQASTIDKIAKQASQALEAAKAAAGDVSIETQSKYFNDQAEEHRGLGKWWLGVTAAVLAAIIALAGWSVRYYLKNPPKQSEPQNVQLIVAKVVLFSALFTALIAATRAYRAHRHNYVINKHRFNALRTFRAFAEQANADPTTKNAVLLQTTQAIFAPQISGYSAQEPDSAYSPIIEIVRGITPSSRP